MPPSDDELATELAQVSSDATHLNTDLAQHMAKIVSSVHKIKAPLEQVGETMPKMSKAFQEFMDKALVSGGLVAADSTVSNSVEPDLESSPKVTVDPNGPPTEAQVKYLNGLMERIGKYTTTEDPECQRARFAFSANLMTKASASDYITALKAKYTEVKKGKVPSDAPGWKKVEMMWPAAKPWEHGETDFPKAPPPAGNTVTVANSGGLTSDAQGTVSWSFGPPSAPAVVYKSFVHMADGTKVEVKPTTTPKVMIKPTMTPAPNNPTGTKWTHLGTSKDPQDPEFWDHVPVGVYAICNKGETTNGNPLYIKVTKDKHGYPKVYRMFVNKSVKNKPSWYKLSKSAAKHYLTGPSFDVYTFSTDELGQFGKVGGMTHGFCMVCGKHLSDPKSVAAGIGPVCAKMGS